MYLHSLAVQNFRALQSAQVSFDQTTVLIGENDCGMSSLLDALSLTLDPAADGRAPVFQPYHFHRGHDGAVLMQPIRIELHFRERESGDWSGLEWTPLGFVLKSPVSGLRELVLEVHAPPVAGQAEVLAGWILRVPGDPAGLSTQDPQALAYLRHICPLVRLRGGVVGDTRTPMHVVADRGDHLTPQQRALVSRIEQCYNTLITGTTPDLQATLNDGYAAARGLIESSAHHYGGSHHFQEMVAEILGQRGQVEAAHPVPPGPQFSGVAAERIGVLLLMATLLRAMPGRLTPGAEPIWVIENPEAQLHPMTLASVLAMVGRIRWQKILTTHSGDVLGAEPLGSLRRLTRKAGVMREWRVRPRSLSAEDLRRVGYHLRSRRGGASFARCWLLVEGETEFWVMPELARVYGVDFATEGIACVEFAQCGLRPLIKLARELGIEWHILADGDRAGEQYIEQAKRLIRGEPFHQRLSSLHERDIEHCFFAHGYAPVFRRLAGEPQEPMSPQRLIHRAIRRHSKPMLALELVLAAASRGSAGVPSPLARAIRTCVGLARGTARRDEEEI